MEVYGKQATISVLVLLKGEGASAVLRGGSVRPYFELSFRFNLCQGTHLIAIGNTAATRLSFFPFLQ